MRSSKKMHKAINQNFSVIKTESELAKFADDIKNETIVAVDLEADSMFHYKEKVCLVQMAAGNHNVVIDPIECSDLSILKPLFKNPGITKVFHGADYDVRSLYRDFGIEINTLLDTQLASMFLGIKETSLGAVVQNRFHITLDKKYQKKDWSQRPLPDEMMTYAASDAIHLIPLAGIITRELEKKNRLYWVQEECELLSRVRPADNNNSPLFLKFKGAGRIEKRPLAVLESILKLRKNAAKKKDRPLFKIISSKALMKIATQMPDSIEHLEISKALSKKQFQMYGAKVVKAVQEAKQIPTAKLPVYPRRKAPMVSPVVPKRLAAIKRWRDIEAEKLQLDPSLLFNKAQLTAISVKNPKTMADLEKVDGIKNWQKKEFGIPVLAALKTIAKKQT